MSDAGITLATGATGNTGSGVTRCLLESGNAVRALVRTPDEARGLREAGAEVVAGDLEDPATLIADLLDGVSRVYFCTWNGPTALGHWTNFRQPVTRSSGEPHIVRLSAFGTPGSRIISELQKAEEDLKASGLPWTILQPTFFMQNLMMTVPTVRGEGRICWDWGEGRAGMVDIRDVVDAAVGALTGEAGEVAGGTFVLTGRRAIGFAEVAEILSRVLDREIVYYPSRTRRRARPCRAWACRSG
jgi:NAD(P)H dehydrogenase (quinone)